MTSTSNNSETIWILEDDESIQHIYSHTLGSHFDLVFFSSLSLFYDHLDKPLKKTPVILLADLSLEDGNSVDFLKSERRKDLGLDVPITIVSADDDADMLRQCFKLGVQSSRI